MTTTVAIVHSEQELGFVWDKKLGQERGQNDMLDTLSLTTVKATVSKMKKNRERERSACPRDRGCMDRRKFMISFIGNVHW